MNTETPESGGPLVTEGVSRPHLRTVEQQLFNGKAMAALVRAVTERGHPFRLQAPGLSMHPFIKHGDNLIISPLTRAPRLGQVLAVAMPPDGRLVVHRLIRCQDTWLQTQGDNCDEPDPHITPGDVLGVVTAVYRQGRRVVAPLAIGGYLLVMCRRLGCPIRPHRWLWSLMSPFRPLGRSLQRHEAYRRWLRHRLCSVPIRQADSLDCLLIGMSPRSLADPDLTVWVAGHSPAVLGAVALVRKRHAGHESASWWLYSLYVRGLFRGGGLAERLCEAVHQRARDEGADAVYLWVRENNEPARRLYTRLGYQQVEPVIEDPPFAGCICMRKELP